MRLAIPPLLLLYSVGAQCEVPQLGYQSDQIETLIYWKQCILCQKDTNPKESLVLNPTGSYHTLLQAIKERAVLQHFECVLIQRRLMETTEEMLLASNAVWHRTSHSNTTNKAQIALIPSASKTYCLQDHILVRKGRKKSLNIDEPSTSSESHFTQSSTSPLNSSLCFFRQVCVSQEQLIKVITNSACEALKLSQNAVFRQNKIEYFNRNLMHMQLTSDHKPCWSRHVFHVLRGEATESNRQTKDGSMQIASLIELINLVDTQTQNIAYVFIDDIETTYIYMLSGTEASDNHVTTFIRK